MTIYGIDINSHYQEQAPYGKFINWPALKADPLNLRFIWIKVAEGTDGDGYTEGAARCVKGALSVGFEAVNPYHYYLYQWCDWSSGAAVWRVISAQAQAQAFYDATIDALFLNCRPMTDIEDPLIDQFLRWSDTATLNNALGFARKLNAHLKAYHRWVTDIFGVRPDIYTGGWWLDKFIPMLRLNGYAAETDWMLDYKFILADYNATLTIPGYIPVKNVIAWQKTSSPKPPVMGIPTGRVVPGDALDIDQWMLSEAEFTAWCGGKEVTTMAGIHKTSVPMADRAWVMEIKADSKVTAGIPSLGVDAVILPMVNTPWDGNHSRVLPEPTFAGRFTEAGAVPVFGKIELDAGIVTTEQHTQPEFDGHTVWQNIYIPKILDAWHVGPWAQNNLKPADFRPIKGLIIEQVTTEDHQTPSRPIEDFWQAYMFRYVADKLRVLMAAEAIPTVPIILKTTGAWLQKYQGDYSIMLYHPDRVKWLYLMLSDPRLESTSQFADLWSIYKNAPGDGYKYPYVPDGYADRVVLFEFTAGKQGLSFVTGNNKAYLSKAFAAAAEFDAWMGADVESPPVEPPPAGTGELEERVANLELLTAGQDERLDMLQADLEKLYLWIANGPK